MLPQRDKVTVKASPRSEKCESLFTSDTLLVASGSTVITPFSSNTFKKPCFNLTSLSALLYRLSIFRPFILERHNRPLLLLFCALFSRTATWFHLHLTSASTHFSIRHSRVCEQTPGAYRPNGKALSSYDIIIIIIITGDAFNTTSHDGVHFLAEMSR